MKATEWKVQALANLNKCVSLFKKGEIQTIYDFIETSASDMEEAEKKLEGPNPKPEVKTP